MTSIVASCRVERDASVYLGFRAREFLADLLSQFVIDLSVPRNGRGFSHHSIDEDRRIAAFSEPFAQRLPMSSERTLFHAPTFSGSRIT
jgi:hypothetical protein